MKLLIFSLLLSFCTISIFAQNGTPPAGIKFENRTDVLNAPDCNPSEVYLKKKVKAQLAGFYKEYPNIAVDFTSFKGQNGYSDKENSRKIIYPYKIEMLVYLKRQIMKEGKQKTEYCIWKYDAVYKYATIAGKKCEFDIVPSSQKTLITRREY